ncbi:glycosyltransferase [Neobacillus sp. Marseille-QA0830]
MVKQRTKNKAYIYGYFDFPRKGATSNYIQYLALAMMAIGYEPVVLIPARSKAQAEGISFKGIRVEYIRLPENRFRHFFDFNFRLGTYFVNRLEKLGVQKGDILISYTFNGLDILPVLKLAQRSGAKAGACVTEYFSSDKFKKGKLNWRYWRYEYTYSSIFPKLDFMFPISKYIAKKYENAHCKVMCLPIMADTSEYPFLGRSINNKIKIIYSANGGIKDSLEEMLEAISNLSKKELESLEFHITSVGRDIIEQISDKRINALLDDVIILHDWLEYDELIKLYQRMNFLLLAREENQMTLANFPSKVPEAMTHGVVPVVSRVGDYTKYYLKDGFDSIIFNGSSVDDCISAIRRVLSLSTEEYVELSLSARKTAVERFDYKNWLILIGNFLKSIN